MSMRHTELTEDLQERASLYAAGAMTDSEKVEYVRHLEEDQCAVCRAEVDELQSAISLLAFTVPAATPSPSVKARLMEQARNAVPPVRMAEERRAGFRWLNWVTAAVAVASMAITFAVIRVNTELRRLTDELNSRIAQLEVRLAGQQNQVAMLTAPGVRVVELAGQGTNVQATARIFVDQQQKRWFIYVRGLPPAPADRDYQLWFVPKSGNPVSATVFDTNADGSFEAEIPLRDDLPELKAAAVTTEPAGGRTQPTGAFALLGAL
jgi:anti-sigma-K factor RskA